MLLTQVLLYQWTYRELHNTNEYLLIYLVFQNRNFVVVILDSLFKTGKSGTQWYCVISGTLTSTSIVTWAGEREEWCRCPLNGGWEFPPTVWTSMTESWIAEPHPVPPPSWGYSFQQPFLWRLFRKAGPFYM